MTYALCKKIISQGKYDKTDMLSNLDIFLLGKRIGRDEYEELVKMLN